MKRVIILNPQSRHGRAGRLFEQQREEWEKRLGEFELLLTTAPGDATRKVRAILEGRDVDQILIAGGDGSINEAMRGYWDGERFTTTDIPLGLINFGTGGDFIRTVRASSEDYDDALDRNRFRMVDAACVTTGDGETRPFLNIASIGMAGAMLRRLKRSQFQAGSAAYFYHSLRTLLAFEPKAVVIEATLPDGGKRTIEADLLNAFVCNGRFSGGGMQWAPGAELDSGRFRVTLIRGGNKAALVRHSRKIYSGKLEDFPGTETFDATELVAKCDDPLSLETDGEVAETMTDQASHEFRFRLMPRTFPLVL